MSLIDTKIREIARQWIQDGDVDLIIGWEKGKRPHLAKPFFAHTVEDTDNSVFNPFCYQNLVTHLKKTGGKTGIIVRGCDGRSLVELIKENIIDRSRLKILAVECPGMIDKWKLKKALGSNYDYIDDITIEEDNVHISAGKNNFSLGLSELLPQYCQRCTEQVSLINDVVTGEKKQVVHLVSDQTSTTTADERWEYFQKQMQNCIRCYACREVCPMCGCNVCFVDRNQPQWPGKSINESDTMIFHLVRALHMAGRCVSCGACYQACPTGVDMEFLDQRMHDSVKENFGYEPGTDENEPPVLQSYKSDDPEDFIK